MSKSPRILNNMQANSNEFKLIHINIICRNMEVPHKTLSALYCVTGRGSLLRPLKRKSKSKNHTHTLLQKHLKCLKIPTCSSDISFYLKNLNFEQFCFVSLFVCFTIYLFTKRERERGGRAGGGETEGENLKSASCLAWMP